MVETAPNGAVAPSSRGVSKLPDTVWWATDARRDPWRDPNSQPLWMRPQLASPTEPAPVLNERNERPLGGKLVALTLVVSLIAGLMGGIAGFAIASQGEDRGFSLGESGSDVPDAAKRPPQSVAGVVESIEPTVVTVEISLGGSSDIGNGSGFVISEDGYILTNSHVAEAGSQGVDLDVVFSDGVRSRASIVGRDPSSDVAVLKVDRKDLTTSRFGNSDAVRVGDPTIALGAPLGLSQTVTTGIVSALDRPVVTGGEPSPGGPLSDQAYMAAIQTDAAINPGNSGGPLTDGEGKVIGINSAIASIPTYGGQAGNIGIGFAIPINQAKRIAEQIISTGSAKTTIFGAVLDSSERSKEGAHLRDVEDAGPAQRAGLRGGDVVKKFNGRVVENSVALIALTRKEPGGARVKVEYERNGNTATTEVALIERKAN